MREATNTSNTIKKNKFNKTMKFVNENEHETPINSRPLINSNLLKYVLQLNVKRNQKTHNSTHKQMRRKKTKSI